MIAFPDEASSKENFNFKGRRKDLLKMMQIFRLNLFKLSNGGLCKSTTKLKEPDCALQVILCSGY